jgi:hydroxyacylglutathione hydrolase
MGSPLEVVAVPVLTDNYVWLIHDAGSGETAAVDPSVAEPVLDAVGELSWRVSHVLNTHWHPDHTGGNAAIQGATASRITAPAEAERVSRVDRIVTEGDRVRVGDAEAMVWEIPAHTAGHIAYYFESERMIFVGDTMFAMGCGRLFEGTAEQMYANLKRIAALPGDVRIYCGHEYTLANARFAAHAFPDSKEIADRLRHVERERSLNRPTVPTTVAEERSTNPFLLANDVEHFADLRRQKDDFR